MNNERQAGRPTKKPTVTFNPLTHGIEVILAEDLESVLRSSGAPKVWRGDILFMLSCLLCPNKVKAAIFRNGTATATILEEVNDQTYIRENLANAMRLGDLFARDPDMFLRLFSELNSLVEKRLNSTEFQTAVLLASDPKTWNEKTNSLSQRFSKLFPGENKPTAKVIEKARSRLRKARPL